MKKLVLGSILAASLLSITAFADEWTGFVGDSKCAGKHAMGSEKDAACAKTCIKGGADPVFLTGDGKVLKFDADSKDKAVAHAGENVKINGSLADGMVKIDTIETASK